MIVKDCGEKSFMEFKSEVLLSLLDELGVHISNAKKSKESLVFNINIWAKPASKKEKIHIGSNGELIVHISARPVEGAANKAISKYVGKKMGLSATSLELIGGEKSKCKRFSVSYTFTEHKNVDYYLEKLIEIFK